MLSKSLPALYTTLNTVSFVRMANKVVANSLDPAISAFAFMGTVWLTSECLRTYMLDHKINSLDLGRNAAATVLRALAPLALGAQGHQIIEEDGEL